MPASLRSSIDTALSARSLTSVLRRFSLSSVILPSRKRGPKPDTFSALPAEIRQLIYTYYFDNSIIRYYRDTDFHRGKRTKRAYCQGPAEIALLLTNHAIYHEALPVLLCSLTLLIDRTEAFNALRTISKHTPPRRKHTRNPFPPFLLTLTLEIRHLVLSNIHCQGLYEQIEPFSRPKPFPHLRTTTLFGVYPDLANFMDYGDTVLLGGRRRGRHWYWPVAGRAEVDLDSAARKLHDVLGLDAKQMPINLRAWCQGCSTIDWRMSVLLVGAALDDPALGYQWDVLAWRNVKGLRRWTGGISIQYLARMGRSWKRFEKETELMRRRLVEQEEEGMEEEQGQNLEQGEGEEAEGDENDLDPVRQPISGWSERCDPATKWFMDDEDHFLWLQDTDADADAGAGAGANLHPPVTAPPQQHTQDTSGTVGHAVAHPWIVYPDSPEEEGEEVEGLSAKMWTCQRQDQEAPTPTARRDTNNIDTANASATGQLRSPPDKDVINWTTITETGDWQSVRSAEVAFTQWDAALDLSLAPGARW